MLFMAAQRKRVRRAQKKKMSDYPNTGRWPGILNRTITSRERNWHSGGFGKDPKSRRMGCKTRLPAKGSSMGKLACWKTSGVSGSTENSIQVRRRQRGVFGLKNPIFCIWPFGREEKPAIGGGRVGADRVWSGSVVCQISRVQKWL